MPIDKPEEPSKPLVDAYAEADKQFGKLEDTGRLLIETARQQRDARDAIVKFAKFADNVGGVPQKLLKGQISAVNRSADTARMLTMAIEEPLRLFSSAVSATANTTVAFGTGFAVEPFFQTPEMTQPVAELVGSLNTVFDRGQMVAKVRGRMVQLGLDRSPTGHNSPVQLLDEAEALMARPTGAPNVPLGAFIALRSAVDNSMEAIRRRAPNQEPTKGVGKIVSLGRRCGKPGLAIAYFERFEVEWGELHDKLSDGKSAQLPRDQSVLIFTNGLSFLLALLEAIDGAVLKQVTR
jgi:hypothetical protein